MNDVSLTPDLDSAPTSRARGFYPGWRVVGACFVLAFFGWGVGFYGPGIYLTELRARTGWSVALIASATTFYYLASAALIVVLPYLMRRLGQRKVIVFGIGAMALGVGILPAVTAPWQLITAYAAMSVGWSTMSSTAIATVLAPWFVRRRGFAISLAFNGASCGGIVIAPALVLLIGRLGFARGVTIVVAAMLAILVPIILSELRWPSPEAIGRHPDDDTASASGAAPHHQPRQAVMRSLHFWGIAVPFALSLMAQVGFLTHQMTFLRPHLGADAAGLAIALTTAAAVTGRLGLGFVVDRIDRRRATAATFLLQTAALILMTLAPDSAAALYLGCAAYGLSVGNVVTLPALIIQQEFAAAAFGPVLALATAISQVTYAFGPGLIGWVRDLSGGYGSSLALCALLDLAAALIILIGRRT